MCAHISQDDPSAGSLARSGPVRLMVHFCIEMRQTLDSGMNNMLLSFRMCLTAIHSSIFHQFQQCRWQSHPSLLQDGSCQVLDGTWYAQCVLGDSCGSRQVNSTVSHSGGFKGACNEQVQSSMVGARDTGIESRDK